MRRFRSVTSSEPAADLLRDSNGRKEKAVTGPASAHIQDIIARTNDAVKESRLIAVLGSEVVDIRELGWRLASQSGWEYRPWASASAPLNSAYVVVDNVAPTRTASRRLREILSFDDADAVVALVGEPLPEVNTTIRTD